MPMANPDVQPQTSPVAGGPASPAAPSGPAVRGRNHRWGWSRRSDPDRERSDWMAVWVRSGWRRSRNVQSAIGRIFKSL